MAKLFGIKNCDTVKKARQWLDAHSVVYEFHDVRADGLTESKVQQWLEKVDWQLLVNKRSTTWKQLSDEVKDNLSEANLTQVLLDNPTLIKRPVLEHEQAVFVGFKAADYDSIFTKP
jgi:arsenate reductase